MEREQCEHRNKFCFVCGLFTPKSNGRNINKAMEDAYEKHFQMDYMKAWFKPEIVCDYCRTGLQKAKPTGIYALPIQWLHRSEHSPRSCYFCINNEKTIGFRYKTRDKIEYEMVDSVVEPVRRADDRNVTETYDNIGAILKLIQYEEYQWFICADLKIVAILMGLRQGYSKHQCFLCLWEGRKNDLHYDYSHKWAPRNRFKIGEASQEKEPLVKDRSKILLPPLHIKLGLVRNFTMKLHRDGVAYECLLKIMKKLGVSAAKVGNGENVYKFDILFKFSLLSVF